MAERTASEVADRGDALLHHLQADGALDRGVLATFIRDAADMLRTQQWRPIETAPKDGTWILGWAAVGEEPGWSGAEVIRFNTRGRTLTRPAGWHDSHRAPYAPTLWQPLPAAPQEPR